MVNGISDGTSAELVSQNNESTISDAENDNNDCQRSKGKHCSTNPVNPLHVHEVYALTGVAEHGKDSHQQRILAITSEPKLVGKNNHYHEVIFKTDFYGKFFHEGWGKTGGAVRVGDGHVHFLEGTTTVDDGHWHRYRIATSLDGFFE